MFYAWLHMKAALPVSLVPLSLPFYFSILSLSSIQVLGGLDLPFRFGRAVSSQRLKAHICGKIHLEYKLLQKKANKDNMFGMT